MAITPQSSVKYLVALTKCFSDFSPFIFRLYISIAVVDANAVSPEAEEDIAADRITASKSPIKPEGR